MNYGRAAEKREAYSTSVKKAKIEVIEKNDNIYFYAMHRVYVLCYVVLSSDAFDFSL